VNHTVREVFTSFDPTYTPILRVYPLVGGRCRCRATPLLDASTGSVSGGKESRTITRHIYVTSVPSTSRELGNHFPGRLISLRDRTKRLQKSTRGDDRHRYTWSIGYIYLNELHRLQKFLPKCSSKFLRNGGSYLRELKHMTPWGEEGKRFRYWSMCYLIRLRKLKTGSVVTQSPGKGSRYKRVPVQYDQESIRGGSQQILLPGSLKRTSFSRTPGRGRSRCGSAARRS